MAALKPKLCLLTIGVLGLVRGRDLGRVLDSDQPGAAGQYAFLGAAK